MHRFLQPILVIAIVWAGWTAGTSAWGAPPSIAGTIRNSSGEPLPSAAVNAVRQEGGSYFGSSDASGAYQLSALPTGTYRIRVTRDPYLGQYYGGSVREEGATPLDLESTSELTGIDVVLPDGDSIRGQVRDAGGSPIPYAAVYVYSADPSFFFYWYPSAYADASGFYRVWGLPAGPVVLQAAADGYVPEFYPDALFEADATVLNLSGNSHPSGVDFYLSWGATFKVAAFDATTGLPAHELGSAPLTHPLVHALARDVEGNVWIGTEQGATGLVNGATIGLHAYNSVLPNASVTAVAVDANGDRYFGTYAGLAVLSSATADVFTSANIGLPDDRITALAVHGGDVWLGMENGDLTRLRAGVPTIWSATDRGLPTASAIRALAVSPATGMLWLGSEEGAQYYDNVAFHRLTMANSSLPGNDVHCIAAATDGYVWIGTTSGLLRTNLSNENVFTLGEGLPSSAVYAISLRHHREAWLGTGNGIARILNEAVQATYTPSNSNLSQFSIRAILAHDAVYAGGSYGLDILEGGSFRVLPGASGFVTFYAEPQWDWLYSGYGYIYARLDGEINGLPGGEYVVRANASGYAGTWYSGAYSRKGAEVLSATLGQTHPETLIFALQRPGSISGNVEDASGIPIGFGTVRALALSDDSLSFSASIGGGGAYVLSNLPPGDYYVYAQVPDRPAVFYDGSFHRSGATPVGVAGGQAVTSIKIVVPLDYALGSLAGQVRDENGQPFPFALVRVMGVDGTSLNRNSTADGLGRYRVADLLPGTYRVQAEVGSRPILYHPGTYLAAAAGRVELGDGQARTGIDIVAPAGVVPGAVEGMVRDASGVPVAGASLGLYSPSVSYGPTLSSSTGFYRFHTVWPEDGLWLQAVRQGFAPAFVMDLAVLSGQTLVADVNLGAPYPAQTRLAGTIRDASGNRLWGVYVNLYLPGVMTLAETRSEWDGYYGFASVPTSSMQVSYNLFGFAATQAQVTAAAGTETILDATLPYELASHGVIWGRILDASGQPAPGLRVQLTGPSTVYVDANADGVYIAPRLVPGTWSVKSFSLSEFSSQVSGLDLTAGLVLGDVDVTLSIPVGRISGTVRDASAQLLAEAVVIASPLGQSTFPGLLHASARGDYTICGVRPGVYALSAYAPGHARQYHASAEQLEAALPIAVAPGQHRAGVDFSLLAALRVRGTVRNLVGQPLPYAYVQVESPDGTGLGSVNANSQGEFEAFAREPWAFRLRAESSNYARQYYALADLAQDAVILSGTYGQTLSGIDFSLAPTAVLSGTVVNASGDAYNCGTVRARPLSSPEYSSYGASLNSLGAFTIANLPPGVYALEAAICGKYPIFHANAYSVAEASHIVLLPGEGVADLVVVVPEIIASASIAGRITRPDGSPISGRQVRVTGVDGTSGTTSTNTNGEGYYVFTGRPPGVYVVSTAAPSGHPPYYHGGTYSLALAERVAVGAGQTASAIDIIEPVFQNFATLTGTVRDPLAAPVADVQLELTGTDLSRTTTSRPDGSYAFYELHALSPLTLSARKAGYQTASIAGLMLSPGSALQQDVVLAAEPGLRVFGTVRNASGSPLHSAFVALIGQDRTDYLYTFTNIYGEFLFEEVPPGHYRFEATLSGHLSQGLDWQSVHADREWNPMLDFSSSWGVISGVVQDASGRPAYGITVSSQGPTSAQTTTNPAGRYFLANLSAGAYRVYLPNEAESGYPEATGVGVLAGQLLEGVDFALSVPYSTISGRISNSSGEALPGASITTSAVGHSFSPPTTVSSLSGEYVVGRVRAGEERAYRVQVGKAGYVQTFYLNALNNSGATPIPVPAGTDRSGVDITLADGAGIGGRLVDRLGLSIPGAFVSLEKLEPPFPSYNASTDVQGEYLNRNLPAGSFRVRSVPSGFIAQYYDGKPTVETADVLELISGQRRMGVDFTHLRGARLAGRVRDASDLPATSGSVRLISADGSPASLPSGSLDSSGAFQITSVPPGNYYLYAQVSGRPIVFYPAAYSRNSATVVSVSDEESLENLVITLPVGALEGGSIAGRIFLPGGLPAAGLSVRIYGVDGTTGSTNFTSNAEGRYQSGVLAVGSYAVAAFPANHPPYYHGGTYQQAEAARLEVGPGAALADVNITLPAVDYAAVSGTVADDLGAPVFGAQVQLRTTDSVSQYTTYSDFDGSWSFPQVFPAGNYELNASMAGYLSPPAMPLAAAPGATLAGLALELAGYAPAMVRGQLDAPDGTPIVNGYIAYVREEGAFSSYVYSDVYGSFTLHDIPPGHYTFSTSITGYQNLSLSGVAVAPGTGNVLHLTPAFNAEARISGRVLDASGYPAPHVAVRTGNGPQRSSSTDALGRYTLAGVSTGTSMVTLPNESGAPQVSGITVVAGSHVTGIDFQLSVAYGTLQGYVYDGSGQVLRGSVWLRGDYFSQGVNTETVPSSSEGHYLIGRVAVEGGRSYRLRATGSGLATQYYSGAPLVQDATLLSLLPGDHLAGLDFVMAEGARLVGKITGSGGAPLANTYVRARWPHAYGSTDFTTYTDGNGNYVIGDLPAAAYRLYFQHDTHLPEYHAHVFTEAEATAIPMATGEIRRQDAQLTLGGSLAGMARNASGNPLAGANITASRVGGSHKSANAQADGSYRIGGLFGGDYMLQAFASGHVTQYYSGVYDSAAAVRVAVATGQETGGINFDLLPEATISGTVAYQGAPVTSGTINAYRPDGTFARSSGLNAQGQYTLNTLAPGPYRLRASAGGYLTQYWPGVPTLAAAADIVVGTGQQLSGIDFALGVGGSLAGSVRNELNEPYSSGTIYVAPLEDPLTAAASVSLGGNGEYVFNSLWPRDYYVYAQLSGKPRVYYPQAFALASAQVVGVTEGLPTTGINLVVPASVPSGTFAGMVRYADGTPVNANVSVLGVDGYSGAYNANTDAFTGAFTRSGIPAGTYVIRVNRSGAVSYYHAGAFQQGLAQRLELRPGESRDDLVITFPDDPAPARVSGTVRDASAQPVAEAHVYLTAENVYLEMLSRPDGSFEFPRVYPGPNYSLGAYKTAHPYVTEIKFDLAPGQNLDGQVLIMARPELGALAGWITDTAGIPLGSVSVFAFSPDLGYSISATSHLDGYYLLPVLPAGVYRLTCAPSGYTSQQIEGVVVQPATTTLRDLQLAFAAGGRISGTVRDASAHPVVGARVLSSNGTGRTVYSGPDGRYVLPALADGPAYRVYLPDEPGIPEATGIAVAAGAVVGGVDFDLTVTYGTITGVVRNLASAPIPGVEVDATSLSGAPKPGDAFSRHDGSYTMLRVRNDEGRSYRLMARDNVHVTQYWDGALLAGQATPLLLAPGESADGINFDLTPGARMTGRVLDAGGQPLAGAELRARHQAHGMEMYGYADPAGWFSIGALAAGSYSLRASQIGRRYEYYDNKLSVAEANLIALATGAVAGPLAIVLEDGGAIAGMVRNTTGEPLFNASLYAENPQVTEGYSTTTSLWSGAYRLAGLPTDRYRVRATRTGYQSAFLNGIDVSDGQTTPLDVVMFAIGEPTWTPTPTATATPTRTATPTPKPLDIRGDGVVDSLDILEFSRHWNGQEGGPADLSGDGQVNGDDLLIFLEGWKTR